MSIKYCCYGMYADVGHSDDCPLRKPAMTPPKQAPFGYVAADSILWLDQNRSDGASISLWGYAPTNFKVRAVYLAPLPERACAAQAEASTPAAKPVAFIGRMDFETLQARGRCTLTAYNEPAGDNSNEVRLYASPPYHTAVMRQALEALEPCAFEIAKLRQAYMGDGQTDCTQTMNCEFKAASTIAALRASLGEG